MNNAYYDEPLVLVDLETTGANATHDRITEIGLVQIDETGVRTWSCLVNPQKSIPPFIQNLTGISNEMVADAPTFAELAPELLLKLSGRVFIAHNARFDYGFLKNEFKRAGLPFRARVLCTVKLSRKLYPAQYKHSLDALVTRHQLRLEGDRHRALTDAALLQQFLSAAGAELGVDTVRAAMQEMLRQPTLPPGIDPAMVDDLPETAGVYLFYGENDALLYVGKSSNIRKRVFSHFAADHRAGKEMQLVQQLRRIDWQETAGELGALLLEMQLIKTRAPLLNQQLRRTRELCVWRLDEAADGALVPKLVAMEELDPIAQTARQFVFGPYRSKREAQNVLTKVVEGQGLCRQVLGLEPKPRSGSGPCFGAQLHQCRGACVGKEPLSVHNARLLSALAKQRLTDWPFPGPVGLREGKYDGAPLQVVDQWCWLGTLTDASDLAELLDQPRPAFDIDTFKLIKTELKRGQYPVVPLY
ncbi:DNA polymerase-3 subunit epsilon [Silvimonas terrae]|uniref:DNA-directed DNA polymerase n=1 Tax=Silvimonas terrae TaxID=300266 RepID=A0A840RG83_9NEIS|nr:exonuclease domain-containing protein [Silvimonas terrae]MBB5191313.1 DNA polymerase-3 subunit epsilon [Silvimonas terrae]